MSKILQPKDAQSAIKTGIWPGRFQFVHNGHEYVLSNILRGFDEHIVAIVNPNPNRSADVNQPRFDKELNPLNFFQRMLLWKVLAEENKIELSIVPSWHIRKTVLFENEFLPYHCEAYPGRCWIIPIYQSDNEYNKAQDLQSLGEIVCDSEFINEPEKHRSITASLTRRLYKSNNFEKFAEYTPTKLQKLTKIFMDAPNEEPYSYLIIPIIDDEIDFTSLQYAINWAKEADNRYVVVAISIGVEDGDEWWFRQAKRLRSEYPYYKKMLALQKIFQQLEITRYLITPIFVQGNDFGNVFSYCSAFLPLRDKSAWVINKDAQYNYNLLVSLETQHVQTIDNSVALVEEKNYRCFCVPELKPLPQRAELLIKQHILNLYNTISDFIMLHSVSTNETELSICARFGSMPAKLMQIIKKLEYNVISEQQAYASYFSLKKQWDEK